MPPWHTPSRVAPRRPPSRASCGTCATTGRCPGSSSPSRLDVSRTTVAAEVGRLAELGLAEDAGPAASRGGRRSTLVDLDAGLRFVGIDAGATSMRVAVTDGRLGVLAREVLPDSDIRRGPEAVLADALDDDPQAARRAGRRPPGRRRHRRAGPGRLPRRRPGGAADHAGLGRLPRARRVVAGARLPGPARQRRQRDGPGGAAQRRRPLGAGLPVRQDRHRDRLRDRRRPAPLPRRRRLRGRHRAHPGRDRRAGLRVRQPGLPRGVLRRRGPRPGRSGSGAERPLGRAGPAAGRARPAHRRGGRRGDGAGRPGQRRSWSATAADGSARCSPAWCRSSTPA